MSSNPQNFSLVMSKAEVEFLKREIQTVKTYLEFGSGGSTILAVLYSNLTKIVSVESDMEYIQFLRKWRIIRQAENKKLFFFPVNIGKVGRWGYPAEEDKRELFPLYSSKVFETDVNYDLVLIDGRFRCACALKVAQYSSDETKILIHDYVNRPAYHCIEQFLEKIVTVDTMVLFKKKKDIDMAFLNELYEKYKYERE